MVIPTSGEGRRRKAKDPLEGGFLAAEVRRLTEQASARGESAPGAVDLMRLHALAPWRPQGEIVERLRAAARDTRRDPLVRAVAWWLVRDLSLRSLDMDTAREAVSALGLISQFKMRAGAAKPLDPVEGAPWRVYPPEVGAGVVWLDAVLRPLQDTEATLVTAVEVSGDAPRPAILRLGFDDQVVVWLNGDEIYEAPEPHRAWLDQAAVPLTFKPGRNRLMFKVKQKDGAWRLVARLTDPDGALLEGVTTSSAVSGPPPEPLSEVRDPEAYAHLWRDLWAVSELDEPPPQGLRDLADYARVTGLPNHDQTEPQIAVESAWEGDPSPRSLRAWIQLIPEARRQGIRGTHVPYRPITLADVVADLFDRLEVGWDHYYARRHRAALAMVDALIEEAPRFAPAWKLKAVILEDMGLPNTAAQTLEMARAKCGEVPGLLKAQASSLKAAGRHAEALGALEAIIRAGMAGADDHFRLAGSLHLRGQGDEAVRLLDGVTAKRPELWYHALEAAQIRLAQRRWGEALERLRALDARLPDAPAIVEQLAEALARNGDEDEARAQLARALKLDPGNELLEQRLGALSARSGPPELGPPLDELTARPDPKGQPAHVLYHHARTEVQPTGLATRRTRRVVRLLDAEGARQFAEWPLAYVPGRQRLEIHTARLYRGGQPPSSPARGDRDLSEPEYRLYYDLRAEVLTFDQPRPGDVIEVSWSLIDLEGDPAFPGYYGELGYLQEFVPRAESVVEIAGPLADQLSLELVPRGLKVETSTEEGARRFVSREVPPVPWEVGMPGGSSLRAFVHVSTARDWQEIDTRYRTLLADRDKPDRALKALAREWTRGVEGLEAQVGRLYAEVAARTRYVGLELGLHSFQPELPRVTLARGYGDCKDKATLLIALARALGHDARLTLVRTRRAGTIPPKPASLAVFNHAIVYLPGLDRFVDPTVDRNDPWTLPPPDQGAVAFVVGQDDAPRRIPVQPSKVNLSDWRLLLNLDKGGVARGRWRWETRGHPGTVARRALEAEGSRPEVVARALGERFPGVKILDVSVEGIRPAFDPVLAQGRMTLPRRPGPKGKAEIPLGGGPWQLVGSYAEAAERATPLQLSFKHTWRQRIELRLPPGWSASPLPPVKLESPFGEFTGRVEISTGQVVLHAELRFDVWEVSPEDYPAFRAWLGQIDEALARVVEVGGA